MRFRKSIKIVPGIKVNFSKSGVSSTFGAKGLSVNVGKNGAYLNTGIPGTGISNRTKLDGGKTGETASDFEYSESEAPPVTFNTTEKKHAHKVAKILLAVGLIGLVINPILGIVLLFFAGGFFLIPIIHAKKEENPPEYGENEAKVGKAGLDQPDKPVNLRREPERKSHPHKSHNTKVIDYNPIIKLCSEIENDTENNYIPFEPSIPAEIVYCDNENEITQRQIDILYIAKANYNENSRIQGASAI